jgi:hypothetical protein
MDQPLLLPPVAQTERELHPSPLVLIPPQVSTTSLMKTEMVVAIVATAARAQEISIGVFNTKPNNSLSRPHPLPCPPLLDQRLLLILKLMSLDLSLVLEVGEEAMALAKQGEGEEVVILLPLSMI